MLRATLIFTACTLFAADEVWVFDRLDKLGGHTVTVEGHPKIVKTPIGKAMEFNGVDDALFLDVHPLAGAKEFTWEVIFSPAADGKAEQRFFHFQETGSPNRLLMETRLANGQWSLDSFAQSAAGSRALLDRAKQHAAGAWYHVATVFDGRELRNYVNGMRQGEGDLKFTPHSAGKTSVGVRINKVDYFKGKIRMARMTPRALLPTEFMPIKK
ncbi:MAG: LamG domain-containing protein [Bryobacteraceae bacterium]|nr:LamG domain-containing protein [Bryobacteraceae bacterium]